VAERSELTETLTAWIERMRLDKSELTRLAGIGRQTLYRLLDGERPQPETLRKIARGLATDPRSRDIDPILRREALRDFEAATGLELLDADEALNLEAAIRAEGIKSPRQASKLAAFLRKYPNMTDDERRLVDALIDHLGDE
jgi:transcriptional regulator with XRE-family HTH domain